MQAVHAENASTGQMLSFGAKTSSLQRLLEGRIRFDFPWQTNLCIFESMGNKNGAQVLFGRFSGKAPVPFHILKGTGQGLSENSFPHPNITLQNN